VENARTNPTERGAGLTVEPALHRRLQTIVGMDDKETFASHEECQLVIKVRVSVIALGPTRRRY
jgi:hypothetical protein